MKQVEPFLNLNLDLSLPGCGLAGCLILSILRNENISNG